MKMLIMGAAALAMAGGAHADKLQYECKNLKGKHYYAHGGAIDDANVGWIDDGLSKGVFVTQFDLKEQSVTYRYKDATGVWYDPVTDEGGFVALVAMNTNYDGSFQFMVVTEGPDASNVTTVVISGVGTREPRMLMNATRHGQINSSRTFSTSDCEASAVSTGGK